ncbi:hypothetical protein [Mycoplasma procyoni]|uniref:hypothetical protein n=1 Tax=Mycoplasma procyoni TaxID=568784 RepID=UPI00197B9B02|nr:hypothetical protein [Mycoplasma procyoni]MBN3534843.1 hypothetical protein [Mycoplasma procyoni]
MVDNIDWLLFCSTKKEDNNIIYWDARIHPEINKYIECNKKITEALKEIKINKSEENYERLFKLFASKYGKANQFNCFLKMFIYSVETLKKRFSIFTEIADHYIQCREIIQMTNISSVQAKIDDFKKLNSKKIRRYKLEKMLKDNDFEKTETVEDFLSKEFSFIFFDKSFDSEKLNNYLDFPFLNNTHTKMFDVCFKIKDKLFVLKARRMREKNSGTSKQIDDLLANFNINNQNKNLYIISFLDGAYSDKLLHKIKVFVKNKEQKIQKSKEGNQIKNIIQGLKENENSYWLNTEGLILFLKQNLKN